VATVLPAAKRAERDVPAERRWLRSPIGLTELEQRMDTRPRFKKKSLI